MKDYYAEIVKSLERIENGQYAIHNIEWCADRIVWAWQWRKITADQMTELTERVCAIFDKERISIERKRYE